MARIKLKRRVVSPCVYKELKSLGYAGDSFNSVLVRILQKKSLLLESNSRVPAREKTPTVSTALLI